MARQTAANGSWRHSSGWHTGIRRLGRMAPPPAACLLACLATVARADETCRFDFRAPRIGDRGSQSVELEMNMIVTFQQAGQVIQSTDQGLRRRQQRSLTVLAVDEDRVTEAKVRFDAAWHTRTGSRQPAQPQAEPVAGKTYHVLRKDDDTLRVTDEQGQRPPAEEVAIVTGAMESLGRHNPLTLLLRNKTIPLGRTLRLPPEVANELLGFREAIGEVTQFTLTLSKTASVADRQCADFAVHIEARSPYDPTGTLVVEGQLLVELATCRMVAMQITCPLQMAETRGPKGARFTVAGRGTLHVAMRAAAK